MNVGAAVEALAFDTITLTRPVWTLTNGVQTVDNSDATDISASVTQLSGRDLERLPEGRRTRGAIQVFATSEVLVADRITWHGEEYEVDVAEDYSTYGYWRALATRVLP